MNNNWRLLLSSSLLVHLVLLSSNTNSFVTAFSLGGRRGVSSLRQPQQLSLNHWNSHCSSSSSSSQLYQQHQNQSPAQDDEVDNNNNVAVGSEEYTTRDLYRAPQRRTGRPNSGRCRAGSYVEICRRICRSHYGSVFGIHGQQRTAIINIRELLWCSQ